MKNSTDNLIQQLPSVAAMDKRVVVQDFTTTRDVNGAEVITWADKRTDWAMVEYSTTGNDEEFLGDQHMAVYRIKITMRYRGDITEKMRFAYDIDGNGAKIFDILFKKVLGRRKFEQFTCENRT